MKRVTLITCTIFLFIALFVGCKHEVPEATGTTPSTCGSPPGAQNN